MIKAEHLAKEYRGKQAVEDVTFSVKTGKVTGFLGPNGAGKSTTMRLMLGLDVGAGKTTYDGKQLRELDQPSKAVGALLEAKAFHPTRSARNHLRVLAAAGGIPAVRADEVLQTVGLRSVADKAPGKFSLGMSQRLGIAAAILGRPKYLLLDEPANGLDPEGIAWLREFLKAYADQGNAVFVSSHLLSEMALMADNIIVIGKGKLIVDTSMKDLLSRGAGAAVYVRAAKRDIAKLRKQLASRGMTAEAEADGLRISSATTDEVGAVAFESGVAVLELVPRQASLEDAFLKLTGDVEEYKTVTNT